MPGSSLQAQDYHVGWICAVQTEYVVACELLDEEYPPLAVSSPRDNNTYTFGRIGHHNIVIACLPKGKYGLTPAASVAKDMFHSFPAIRFGLMVGIGGGAPSAKHDIRLGDVVVSSPVGRTGGVIHYEFGKTIQNQKFKRTGSLDAPPAKLLTALNVVSALHERKGHRIAQSVDDMIRKNPRLRKKYQQPPSEADRLYESSFIHPEPERGCAEVCRANPTALVQRPERDPDLDNPVIHYGLIASADRLMKDAQVRDILAQEEGVLCFEMEAAGLMDHFPCVVVRGICDYSDTHKNDEWQGFAAATAAAYAKELLNVIAAADVSSIPTTFNPESTQANPRVSVVVFGEILS
jgi:nucleoside phosphorylase